MCASIAAARLSALSGSSRGSRPSRRTPLIRAIVASLSSTASPTPRARWARVTGTDVHGRPVDVAGEGLLARCLQHETDHLDGTLYVDRVRGEDRRRIMRQLRDRDFGSRSQAVTGQRSGRVSSAFGAGASVAPGASFGGGR